MNFDWIKYRLATRKLRSLPQTGRCEAAPSGRLKSAVVLDVDEGLLLERLLDLCKDNNREFEVVPIVHSQEERVEGMEVLSFSGAALSWAGNFRNEGILQMLQDRFEVLIIYSERKSASLGFLLENFPAKIKIGRKDHFSEWYDISIDTRFEEPEIFLKEVELYLKILKTIK